MKVTRLKKRTRCFVIAEKRIMNIEKTEALPALSGSQILIDLDYFGIVLKHVVATREDAGNDDLRAGEHAVNRMHDGQHSLNNGTRREPQVVGPD